MKADLGGLKLELVDAVDLSPPDQRRQPEAVELASEHGLGNGGDQLDDCVLGPGSRAAAND